MSTKNTTGKWVDVTFPEVGDLADHTSRDLDPRPVCKVDMKARLIQIEINGQSTTWLDMGSYTYKRFVPTHEHEWVPLGDLEVCKGEGCSGHRAITAAPMREVV